ncbi:MAG: putative selenium-dependent hydroxylase accessory protein YqeC [bacterium]|nr:putative selenium-dependent hydroxylase accessory protein YqeC [bacterium]
MNFSFVDPWHLFLPRDGGHVVGICGSGGKTSILKAMGEVLKSENIRAILTNTTRSEAVSGFPVFDLSELETHSGSELPGIFYLRDGTTSDGKWRGLAATDVDRLGERFNDRVIVAEVDGSAGLPLKFYRSGEPVWPARTSLAVLAMSQKPVGEKAGAVVHRFGKQKFEPLKNLSADDVWLWDHSLTLLTAEGGYLDQIPQEVPCVLALPGMGEQDDSIGLFDFVGRAMLEDRLPLVLFCETTGDEPYFRTACRQEGSEDGISK